MSDDPYNVVCKSVKKKSYPKANGDVADDDPIFTLPPYKVEAVFTMMAETVDWGIELVGIPSLWRQTKGEGIKVAVLDTGIALGHPDLRDAIAEAKDFTGSRSGPSDVAGHGCVRPSEKIYTSMCGLQCISDLFNRVDSITHFMEDGAVIKDMSRLGVKVLSMASDGSTEPRKLLAVHKLPYSGKIYKVTTKEGELGLTPWHPVFIVSSRRGKDLTIKKVRADELSVGDMIVSATEAEDFADYLNIPYKDGKDLKYIRLDDDLAYFAGLITSDGHLRKNEYKIEFHSDEQDIADEYCHVVEKLFGIFPYHRDDTIRWYFNRKSVHNILSTIGIPIGNKSKVLDLPELISKSPRSVIYSYYAGIIDSDGSVTGRLTNVNDIHGSIRIGTGSKKFAESTVMLFRTLGTRSSFSKCDLEKSTFGGSDYYMIRIGHNPHLVSKMRIKRPSDHPERHRRQSSAITEIALEDYDGDMYDFTVEDNENYIANGLVVSNTHVAGTIAARENSSGVIGAAPKCKLLVGKVLGDNGSGTAQSVSKGIYFAINSGADIISMSLGSSVSSPLIYRAVKDAVSNGVFVIAAAGNEGPTMNTVGYPGGYKETIAVGAIDQTKKIARFSSRGTQVTIVAPGKDILSTYPPKGLAKLSGTCILEGSYIYGPEGPKTIENVNIGDTIYAYKDGDVVERIVHANCYRGTNEVHRLTASGRYAYVTAEHQVMAINSHSRDLEWVKACELRDHHRLLLPRALPTRVNPYLDSVISEDFCTLLGFFVGDGWLSNTKKGGRICYAKGDKPAVMEWVSRLYEKEFSRLLTDNKNGTWCYDDSTMIAATIEALGMNSYARSKDIPLWLWTLPEKKRLAFLTGYLAADGHTYKKKMPISTKFSFECTSESLVKRMACLADYHGLSHTVVWSRTRNSKAPHMKESKWSTSYMVRLGKDRPSGGWSALRRKHNDGSDIAKGMGININNIFAAKPHFGDKPLSGSRKVYDLCVPDADCFVTQGIITHNSMATPLVSGIVALMLSKHNKHGSSTPINTQADLEKHLRDTAIDLGPDGYDPHYGSGLINPVQLLAVPDDGNGNGNGGGASSSTALHLLLNDMTDSGRAKLAKFLSECGDANEIEIRIGVKE